MEVSAQVLECADALHNGLDLLAAHVRISSQGVKPSMTKRLCIFQLFAQHLARTVASARTPIPVGALQAGREQPVKRVRIHRDPLPSTGLIF